MRSVRLTHPCLHDKMAAKAPAKEERRAKRKEAAAKKAGGMQDGSIAVQAYQPRKKKGAKGDNK